MKVRSCIRKGLPSGVLSRRRVFLALPHVSEDIETLIISKDEAYTYEDHEPTLEHEGKAPPKVLFKECNCDGSDYVARHHSYDHEGVKDSHPLGIALSGRELVDPDRPIYHTEGLSEAKHETHDVEEPYVR